MSQEMAIHGTHDTVMNVLSRETTPHDGADILDIGAGEGALSAKLKDTGFSVSACDLFPEQFSVPGVECRKCDASGALPFSDEQFDAAMAVEVLEHIDGHAVFFREAARILKPGGLLLFTTPNILSLKSRLTFLLTGSFYSFSLLTPNQKDPVHDHISPFTLNRYAWMMSQHGLTVSNVATDKMQSTSLLLSFMVPLIWLSSLLKHKPDDLHKQQSSKETLFGRKLVIVARKAKIAALPTKIDAA